MKPFGKTLEFASCSTTSRAAVDTIPKRLWLSVTSLRVNANALFNIFVVIKMGNKTGGETYAKHLRLSQFDTSEGCE